MGPIGVQEMMLIFLVALVLFGPKKLPELGKLLGKGLTEYRRAKSELKSTFETHLRELEREANVDAALKNPASSYSSPTSIASTTTYDEYGQYEPSYSEPAPYPEAASSSPASSPSSTASAPATQDAEAYRETPSSVAVSPVAGTVPRSNGVQPAAEPHSVVAGPEGHSA
jgi:TatA/E family protein of Tat protein translocase